MAGQQRHRAATCKAAVPIPGEAKPKSVPGAAARAPSACVPLATQSARHPRRRSRGGAALAHGRRRGVPRRGSRGGLLAQGRRPGRRRSPTAAERDGWGGVPEAPGSSVGGRRSTRLRRPPPRAALARTGRRSGQPNGTTERVADGPPRAQPQLGAPLLSPFRTGAGRCHSPLDAAHAAPAGHRSPRRAGRPRPPPRRPPHAAAARRCRGGQQGKWE